MKSGEEWVEACKKAIQQWCIKHVGAALPITCEKDYGCTEIWDDVAVGVIANTGQIKGSRPK